MTTLSNSDALLVGVPMIGLLLICHFRLDELVGKPRKSRKPALPARKFSGTDEEDMQTLKRAGGDAWDLPAERRPRVRAELE